MSEEGLRPLNERLDFLLTVRRYTDDEKFSRMCTDLAKEYIPDALHLDDRPAWNADAWETQMLRQLTGKRRPWVNRCSTWKHLGKKVRA